jgi:hypothetical protein
VPRIRTIKPEFFTSEAIHAIDRYRTRLTFVGLWTYCDDNGRARDNAKLIKAAIWPLDDDVTDADVEQDLSDLAYLGRIIRYTGTPAGASAPVPLLQIVNWHDNQTINRRSKCKLPGPDGTEPRDPNEGDPSPAERHRTVRNGHKDSLSTRGVLTEHSLSTHAHVATSENTESNVHSLHTHGALREHSVSTPHRNREQGTGNREGEGEPPRASAPPRCVRHEHLPVDDPGPACVGCRAKRVQAERQAQARQEAEAAAARQARIAAQLAHRADAEPVASPSARQAAREAYSATQRRRAAGGAG